MKVTVALASRNELPMLSMTVLSALDAIRYAGVEGEVLVVDNSDPQYKQAVEKILAGPMKCHPVRLVHEPRPSSARSIDRAHREAKGEFVFYTDAHTLMSFDILDHLIKFYEANDTGNMAFLHAGVQWAHRSDQTRNTHFTTKDSKLGSWAGARMPKEPRKVTWKGMPYLIRKSVWEAINGYGCCAKHGFGWGIMYYLGPKPWLLGYENWAIPEGVAYHFGAWPDPIDKFVNYRTYSKSSVTTPNGTSLAVACFVLGGERLLKDEYENYPMLKRNFSTYQTALEVAKKFGEADRRWVLARQKISFYDLIEQAPWGDDLK